MSALALSCLIFVLTLGGGILLGTLLRPALPEHHLSQNSQDVVRLGVGLIATIAALVLGLLIAAGRVHSIHKAPKSRRSPLCDSARQLACGVWAG
jgi:hypothetical protein